MEKIKNFLHRLFSLELVKTSILSGITAVIKLITGFVINKIIAVYLGPSGLAIIGNFQNFISMANSLATGGISTGVVKYTAEYSNNEEKLQSFISSSFKFTSITSLFIGLIICFTNPNLGNWVVKSDKYNYLFVLFGITIIFFALETFLISVLNGLNEIKKYTVVKILGSIISLMFTGGLSYFFGLKGALIALTINQAILFFFTIFFIIKAPWFNKKYFFKKIEYKNINNLFNFTFMALLFAVLNPLVLMLIRGYIMKHGNIDLAGYWDSLNKLSTNYLYMITTTISVYFLPKYSKLTNIYDIKKEMMRGFKIIIPSLAIVFIFIYILRFKVIDILYSKEFYPAESLFLPRLLSDLLQMVSWIVSYIMLAKAMVKKMIITQVSFSILTYLLSVAGFELYSIEGVMWGNVVRYILYTLLMFYLFRNILWSKKGTNQILK